jgi:hypothetical protein
MTDSSLGLQVIDVATATEVAHYASEAQDVMWTSGRKYLLMHGSQGNSTWTDVIDPERLELVKRFATDFVVPAQQVNGAPVLLVQRSSTVDTQFTVLDPGSLGALADWTLKGYIDLVPRLWSYD